VQCDPHLRSIPDPIPILQVFARQYRTGAIAASHTPVGARTVENALRAVGQTLAALGLRDPRLTPGGVLDIRLARQLATYAKEDPPPARAKPVPLQVITHAAHLCHLANTPKSNAIADMLLIAFYFLLRPGEYAHSSSPDATPFRLRDVHLLIGTHRLDHFACALPQLEQVTTVALEFDRQKNGVRGELVGLTRSGHPHWCPVAALIRRVKSLRQHNAPPTTPLYSFYDAHHWLAITPADLTYHLRAAARAVGAVSGINAADISARSLRSAGAMALLCAGVSIHLIQLLGRWRSTEMLRYLHTQAIPVTAHCAPAMLQGGNFALIPNQRLL
jgi:hypothetical protein